MNPKQSMPPLQGLFSWSSRFFFWGEAWVGQGSEAKFNGSQFPFYELFHFIDEGCKDKRYKLINLRSSAG